MLTIFVVVVVVILAFLLVFNVLINKTYKKVNSSLADDILRGIIHHEIREFLKSLQDDDAFGFAKLRNLCNIVVVYIRLGGTFDELNRRIEVMRLTLLSSKRPIQKVLFGGQDETSITRWLFIENGLNGWVNIGDPEKSVAIYHFDLVHTNTLTLKKEGYSK